MNTVIETGSILLASEITL